MFTAGVALTWLCLRADQPTARPGRAPAPEPERLALPAITPPCNEDLQAWLDATDHEPIQWQARPNPPAWASRAARIQHVLRSNP